MLLAKPSMEYGNEGRLRHRIMNGTLNVMKEALCWSPLFSMRSLPSIKTGQPIFCGLLQEGAETCLRATSSDLVARLADEASKTASHVLNMCVRALDYCPPVDLCYGDYLRALITADRELVSNDEYHYRVAFINAFRKRGIFPEGVPNLSVDTLCYRPYDEEEDVAGFSKSIAEFLRPFKEQLAYKTDRKAIFDETQKFIGGDQDSGITGLHAYLFSSAGVARNAAVFEELTGLIISRQFKNFGIRASKSYGSHAPSINIPTMRLFNKTGPDGNVLNRIVMTIVESADVSITSNKKGDLEFLAGRRRDADTMIFRGG